MNTFDLSKYPYTYSIPVNDTAVDKLVDKGFVHFNLSRSFSSQSKTVLGLVDCCFDYLYDSLQRKRDCITYNVWLQIVYLYDYAIELKLKSVVYKHTKPNSKIPSVCKYHNLDNLLDYISKYYKCDFDDENKYVKLIHRLNEWYKDGQIKYPTDKRGNIIGFVSKKDGIYYADDIVSYVYQIHDLFDKYLSIFDSKLFEKEVEKEVEKGETFNVKLILESEFCSDEDIKQYVNDSLKCEDGSYFELCGIDIKRCKNNKIHVNLILSFAIANHYDVIGYAFKSYPYSCGDEKRYHFGLFHDIYNIHVINFLIDGLEEYKTYDAIYY